jgi:hypothetical protein
LRLSATKPAIKPFAYVSFALTAVVMIIVFVQMRS